MAQKIWNWQSKEWPRFSYEKDALVDLERDFLQKAGTVTGAYKHISPEEKDMLLFQILSDEAMKTHSPI